MLKCELKRFSYKFHKDYNKDVLTKEEYQAVEQFNSNEEIVVRKADKSNTFVILDRQDYHEKLLSLVSDETKFTKLRKDTTDSLKSKLNQLITIVNSTNHDVKINKLIGNFSAGYLYGNPKTHKNLVNPPLRPIISQIGTPTYEIAKLLNDLLNKFLPTKYSINSTNEFIDIINSTNSNGLLASLDVESLFTNVPVNATIKIILNYAYNNPDIPPPTIPKDLMEQLLLVCTTETPFKHPNGDVYLQIDGVSMASPLGPLFANFYMADLENNILDKLNNEDKPSVYCRYVDDIFLLIPNVRILHKLKDQFENQSILKFTYEIEENKKISFLDVNVRKSGDRLHTAVHVKSTNTGDCLNFDSIAPDRYKIGTIKTMLHRAYKICSERTSFYREVDRLKQLFTDNNYPMKTIDTVINRFISRNLNDANANHSELPKDNIRLFYRSQMNSNYKQEERNLKTIIDMNLSPVDETKNIQTLIYYKNRKFGNLFLNRLLLF